MNAPIRVYDAASNLIVTPFSVIAVPAGAHQYSSAGGALRTVGGSAVAQSCLLGGNPRTFAGIADIA